MRPRVRLAVVLVVACAASAARADPTGTASRSLALRIDCPALGAETRALLEARARAELASEPLPGGQLAIDCADTSARVSWQPAAGPLGERTVDIESDPTDAVDRLLEAIDALVTVQTPAPYPSSIAQPVAPGRSALAEAAPSRRDSAPARWAILGGVDSELWQGEIAGAVGGHAGASLWLGGRWHVVVLAGPAWGAETAAGLRAWRLRGVARIEYAPVPELKLGIGASARALWADATSAPTAEPEGARAGTGTGTGAGQMGTSAGGLVSARYGFALGPVAVGAGPEVEALLRPISVEVGGSEVFRMPSVVVGVSIDASSR